MTFGQVPNLSFVLFFFFNVCSCPLRVWSGQDLPSGACLGALRSAPSIHQPGCSSPCSRAHRQQQARSPVLLALFCLSCPRSLDLGTEPLLQTVPSRIPSLPSLFGPCCLQTRTRPGVFRVVAFHPASPPPQAPRPSAAANQHQLFGASLAVSGLDGVRRRHLSSPLVSFPAPPLPF